VTSLSFISVFTPAIALLLGFVFLDERPTLWTAVGGGLILGGVTLALSASGAAPRGVSAGKSGHTRAEA
jgi:drug/metabolite transporter (DMT)-like permease